MRRRDVLKAMATGTLAVVVGVGAAFADEYYPIQVDENLFKGINRANKPAAETGLEKKHWPVIKAPEKVKAGEVFAVDVTIGEVLHPMGPSHWIEYIQINIGNEPAGNLMLQSVGYMKPEGRFNLILGDNLKGKKVSLVVQIKCNLHGIWQNYVNVDVV